MKYLSIVFTLSVMILSSCSNQKESSKTMNDTFYGSYFIMNNENKMVENDIKVTIQNDSLQLFENDSMIFNGKYEIMAQNEDSTQIKANKNELCYLSQDNSVLLKNYNGNEIHLITYSELMKKK